MELLFSFSSGNKIGRKISVFSHITHLPNYILVRVVEKPLSVLASTPVFKSKYIKDMFQDWKDDRS